MPTTMTDVARAAGVSQKTVSRVVNGEPYVSAEIRERVHRAIRDLDFRPNNTARALLKGRHRRIGVVSLGSAHYGPTTLLMALERAMQRAGYAFALAGTRDGRDRSLAAAVASLLTQGVDGVVLSEPVDDGSPLRFRCDVPMVSLGEPVELSGAAGAVVCADGVADARCATEHLLALGHRTVWHIPGPDNWFSARDRERGWRAALAEAGVAAPPLAPRATGPPPPATAPPGNWPATPTSPPSSWPTTRWHSAPCEPSPRPGAASPRTSVSSASTTSRRPPTSPRRSPPSDRTSRPSPPAPSTS